MKKSPASRLRAVAALALLAPLLAACGDPLGGGGTGTGPRVVASFYPLEYVAERVAGEHVDVEQLTAPGVESHDLELNVEKTAAIAGADLTFYLGGYQPAVDEAVEQNASGSVVDAAEVVSLHAAEEEPGHEGESAEEHAAHEGEAGDPHFWLDPVLLGEAATAFTEQMAEVDPDHAADYRANLADLRADLEQLDADYREGLTGCELDTVVVSHDAFGYLEKYGLTFEAVAGLSPDVEPSPAHLAELEDLIRETGVTTVFSETLASPAMARTLASDLDLETGVLDPVEGLPADAGQEDYLSLMRANLRALQQANGCR